MKLRPYQQQCVDAFYGYYQVNTGNGLIVLPTAGGKSIVIGKLATDIVRHWQDQRILILSHVAELIKQNHEKIMLCWPGAPAGIYSSGLKKRQAHFPIVTASIQSVYNKAHMLGHRDLCFIDECHLVNSENSGMYRELLNDLIAFNPLMKVIGFSATDYRMDSGPLTEGDKAIFNGIIIEIPISQLLNEGYLTPPISKSSIVQADLIGVKITAGEYNSKAMAERFDQKEFLNKALDNDMPFFEGRRSIALFCASVENANHVAEGMTKRGIYTEVLDGEMPADERESRLRRFRSGELRGLASVGVMTTGTDVPNIDCLVLLRATKSPGLYQQIIGRGFRVIYANGFDFETSEGRIAAIAAGPKPNFLCLDHGGNVERHGPVTHVAKPIARKKGQRIPLEKPKARICEICRTANTLEALKCIICQSPLKIERDPTAALSLNASDAEILSTPFTRGEVSQWFNVDDVRYSRHVKNGNESLHISYYSGLLIFDEWKRGWFLKEWWKLHSSLPLPSSANDIIKIKNQIKKPRRVMVRKKNKFFEIIGYDFDKDVQNVAI